MKKFATGGTSKYGEKIKHIVDIIFPWEYASYLEQRRADALSS